jgi:hypothetical protein
VTALIERIPVNSISAIFFLMGIAYCFYSIAFRWPAVRNKYGSLGLYWWPVVIVLAFSMTGWLLAVAVWLVQRRLSN